MDSESGDSDTSSESENVPVSNKVLLSDSQKKTLENAIKKQKKFMDGEITKKKLSKKDKESIDTIESSGMTYKEVGNDLKTDGWNKVGKTKCILVKNFTKTLVDSGTISMIGCLLYTSPSPRD